MNWIQTNCNKGLDFVIKQILTILNLLKSKKFNQENMSEKVKVNIMILKLTKRQKILIQNKNNRNKNLKRKHQENLSQTKKYPCIQLVNIFV